MAEYPFPLKGYHKGMAAQRQPEHTSPHINNMRPLDNADKRFRGGQRPGQDKWSNTLVSGVSQNPIVEMVTVTVVEVV